MVFEFSILRIWENSGGECVAFVSARLVCPFLGDPADDELREAGRFIVDVDPGLITDDDLEKMGHWNAEYVRIAFKLGNCNAGKPFRGQMGLQFSAAHPRAAGQVARTDVYYVFVIGQGGDLPGNKLLKSFQSQLLFFVEKIVKIILDHVGTRLDRSVGVILFLHVENKLVGIIYFAVFFFHCLTSPWSISISNNLSSGAKNIHVFSVRT